MKKRGFLFIAFLYISFHCSAQQTLKKNIKSIVLRPSQSNSYAPIIALGESLTLSFDDLDGDQKEYQYKITHMSSDWKPSSLLANEYIDGFNQNRFQDVENSFNTLQNYTHYSVQIPNKTLKLKKTGNYLISVLNDVDQPVFTRRFTVYEKKTSLNIAVVSSLQNQRNEQLQRVQFTLNYNGRLIKNPTDEISVVLLQNDNWQTAIYHLQPQYFKPNQLVYNDITAGVFKAGNEFLNFDNSRISVSSFSIAKSERKNRYHNYLHPQEIRRNQPYTYNPDIDGQFVIRTLEANNPATEADYAYVHFSLRSKELTDQKIYVYGAFNNFECNQENQLHYDEKSKTYTGKILLKQGFYNYCFVSKDLNGELNLDAISGSFYKTENSYTVLVYYQAFGTDYQQAIGMETVLSSKQQ